MTKYQIGIALLSQGVALFCKASVWHCSLNQVVLFGYLKLKEVKTFDNIDHNLKFKFKSKYDQAERVINFCVKSKLLLVSPHRV